MAKESVSRESREGGGLGRFPNRHPGEGVTFMAQAAGVCQVCGATPILVGLPPGGDDRRFNCDAMLGIGLLTIEEILEYACAEGLLACENAP